MLIPQHRLQGQVVNLARKQTSYGDLGDSLHYWLWVGYGDVDLCWMVVDGRDNNTVQHWLWGDYELEAAVLVVVIMVVSIDIVQHWLWGDWDVGDLGVDRVVVVIGDSADRQMRIYLICTFNHLMLYILYFRRPCCQRRPQPRRSWTNSLRVPPRSWSWQRQLRPRPSGIVIISAGITIFCLHLMVE